MKKAIFSILVSTVLLVSLHPSIGFGADLINEGFNYFDLGSRPAGWTFTNCNANSDTFTAVGYYGIASPSIKLADNGDSITTSAFSDPLNLTFWFRGYYAAPTSAFLVEEYYTLAWHQLTNITNIPLVGSTAGPFTLAASANQLRFSWIDQGGDLAFDDVLLTELTAPSPTASATPSTVIPTPTPTAKPSVSATPTTVIPTATPTLPAATPTPTPPLILGCEGFDYFHLGSRPAGWTFVNCDQNSDTYTAPSGYYGVALPSIKLAATGDRVVTRYFGPDNYQCSFWLRGVGADSTSSLLVEEYYSSDWKALATIQPLPASGTVEGPYALNTSTIQLRFSYTQSVGNAALDDVCFVGLVPSPTPTATAKLTPTPTLTPSPIPLPYNKDHFDFNGDGTSDIAIFRSSTGFWSVRFITDTYFGVAGDIPVPGDYDGNDTTDIGIFRNTTSLWAIRNLTRLYFGSATDEPLPGDYDGNGTSDPALFRPTNGLWAIKGISKTYFGVNGDETVPRDYNADGAREIAIFRPGTGLWAVRLLTKVYFGSVTDNAVPAYYRGDGICQIGIFRPSASLWSLKGITKFYFGNVGDAPRPADYDGDRTDDVGLFRSSPGLWIIRAKSKIYFGASGDTPLAR